MKFEDNYELETRLKKLEKYVREEKLKKEREKIIKGLGKELKKLQENNAFSQGLVDHFEAVDAYKREYQRRYNKALKEYKKQEREKLKKEKERLSEEIKKRKKEEKEKLKAQKAEEKKVLKREKKEKHEQDMIKFKEFVNKLEQQDYTEYER